MFKAIAQEIKKLISNYSKEDSLIFKNKIVPINKNNFRPLAKANDNKTIAFIDGGQAEILSAGNFCLSFIRIFVQCFQGNEKTNSRKNEFYLFTTAKWKNGDLFYESRIYPLTEKIIYEDDLFISSTDCTIRIGMERASITRVMNVARRFAELSFAKQVKADFVVLDGTLDATFHNEEKYLSALGNHVTALAKSSALFTTSGNSPVVLLNKIGLAGNWSYQVDEFTSFVKLNWGAKHVFRFSGRSEILPYLVDNSNDALFLGYPYGLIYADKMARVSNDEKKSLMMRFLLNVENKAITEYLPTSDAHDLLDRIN